MAEAMRNSSAAVKAARKKKIRQLEASLFGGGGGGSDVMTGLPELQRVDEYNSTFNTAERRSKPSSGSGSGLPALKKAPAVMRNGFAAAKSRFGIGHRPTSQSDEEELIESSDESAAAPESHPPPALHPPPPTAQKEAARRGSFGILRSEVEQLDDSIRHLVKDPKREVLENLKKRHGVTKSPSMHDGIYTFPKQQGSLTNVAAAAQAPLDRATLLERRRSLVDAPGSAAGRRRAASLDRTSRLLEQEQADLERSMRKADPRFGSKAESVATTPLSAHTVGGQKEFSWPSMPGIKPQAIAIGGKKESLQPIGMSRHRSRSPRQASSPVIPSATSPTSVSPLEDKFGRASKLPAIGKVPDIKINTAHRPRRDPNDETRTSPAPGSLREPTSPTSPKASMVNFEGLERMGSAEKGESLSDYENSFVDVPTNTLDDMPKGTFDDIPSTVFDAIPTAVVERERKRTLLRSKTANKTAGGGPNSRGGSAAAAAGGEQALVSPTADAPSGAGATLPSPAADIFMSGRVESEDVMVSNGSAASAPPVRHQVDIGAVSLITALFPNAAAAASVAAASAAAREGGDQVNSDFVFALYIQEQEQAGLQVNP